MLTETLQKLYELKNYSEVIKTWTDSLISPQQDPPSTYVVAASHFNLGNFLDASKLCSSIDGFYSTDINFLSMYAACLRSKVFTKNRKNFSAKRLILIQSHQQS